MRSTGGSLCTWSLHTTYWNDDPAKRRGLYEAMKKFAYVYDDTLKRVDPLTVAHVAGFPDYTLSQVPLEFEAAK